MIKWYLAKYPVVGLLQSKVVSTNKTNVLTLFTDRHTDRAVQLVPSFLARRIISKTL